MNRFCHYCHDTVDPHDPAVWRRVEGWERKAVSSSRRSGSDITLREPRDEYACPACVMKVKDGIPVGQAALL